MLYTSSLDSVAVIQWNTRTSGNPAAGRKMSWPCSSAPALSSGCCRVPGFGSVKTPTPAADLPTDLSHTPYWSAERDEIRFQQEWRRKARMAAFIMYKTSEHHVTCNQILLLCLGLVLKWSEVQSQKHVSSLCIQVTNLGPNQDFQFQVLNLS